MLKKILILICLIVLILTICGLVVFVSTPNSIKYPQYDHAHFRLDYIYHGKAENFSSDKYQLGYSKDSCTADLAKEPFHFHDNKNNFVHLHWQSMTGGQVLKYYGFNKIDLIDQYLGIRLDLIPQLKINFTPIHANVLPKPTEKDKIYVYSGKPESYTKRELNDFLFQDLEKFFNTKSSIKETLDKEKQINYFTIQAQAHSDEVEKTIVQSDANPPKTEEELKEINNLLGDVIIFVQESEPKPGEIKERLSKLEPLSLSTCGG
jgi:putative lipase involved disintegration of autophagic bodies